MLNLAWAMLGSVHGRIVAGVAAWLLGAGAATGGSLLAVSLIGKGMASSFPSQPDALAAAAAHSAPGFPAPPATPATPTSPAVATARPVPSRPASSSVHARRTGPSTLPHLQIAASGAPGTSAASPDGTVLTSPGGEVVAVCGTDGAYLQSWSPQQGYAVSSVNRGPSAAAQVNFSSDSSTVIMVITCQDGAPVASTQLKAWDE